jgi:hypothetical protein
MDVGTLCPRVAGGPIAGCDRRSLGAATRRKTVTRGAGCLSWARPDLRGERWADSWRSLNGHASGNAGYSQARAYRLCASALSRPPIGVNIGSRITPSVEPLHYQVGRNSTYLEPHHCSRRGQEALSSSPNCATVSCTTFPRAPRAPAASRCVLYRPSTGWCAADTPAASAPASTLILLVAQAAAQEGRSALHPALCACRPRPPNKLTAHSATPPREQSESVTQLWNLG